MLLFKRLQSLVFSEGNHVDRDVVDGFRAKRIHFDDEESSAKLCLSQPELPGIENHGLSTFTIEERPGFSFSQPAHMEDLLLSTQLQTLPNTQTSQVLNYSYSFSPKLYCIFTKLPLIKIYFAEFLPKIGSSNDQIFR